MAFAPPLLAAFIRQLNKAVDATKAEYQMSVQVKGLADIVRDAKRAIDTAGDAATRLRASANAVVATIGQVDDMTRQLDAANADLTAAVGAMTNGGPPLDDTASSEQSSPPASPADVKQASIQVANANSGKFM
ncbi:hypothetical protein [Bradyrhizobium cenepequi]